MSSQSLWRLTGLLCRQLKAVNARLSEALTLSTTADVSAVPRQTPPRVSRMTRAVRAEGASASSIDPAIPAGFPVFKDFSHDELAELLAAMTRWDLPRGTLLFAEGDVGSTCYVVVRGMIDVSVKVRGQAQLLSQLGPGSIFGQASLVEAEPRSVSCSAHRDTVLAEIDAAACERLLDSGSPMALKLLGALNEGIVTELRAADRQLMRTESRTA